ncbi:MAG: EVE domain-containing protein [Myxococcales bacterium]|nr:EVE domain-containing protein [Myxococcales bacterium]
MPKAKERRYWLMKSEPDAFSFDDLRSRPKATSPWDGVRNYQARNFMRDQMQVGDRVLFYHSNANPPGVAGVAEIVSSSYPDPTQFDPKSKYFDPKSSEESPRWFLVDVRALKELPCFVPLAELRKESALVDMLLLQRGSRLSITPITESHYRHIVGMGGLKKVP